MSGGRINRLAGGGACIPGGDVSAVLLDPSPGSTIRGNMSDRRSPERIGHALQALAADLAAERRRVLLLRRENRMLKAKLAALQYDLDHLSNGGTPSEDDRPPPEKGQSVPLAS